MTTTSLCVLLLPSALDDFPRADEVRDLLRAPGVVAIEPARMGRVPGALAEAVAAMQARRVIRKLGTEPQVVVLYDARQYPLARALVAAGGERELWYGGAPGGGDAELHELAVQRAALTFRVATPGPAFQRNAPLWERLEDLGIARR